ncbi:ImmA/IrrE family metallo-endopeptidase [Caenimonas koreensis]|nr:ImmA/IrrE family metallo-endopeptidase [Caenimonas koreensis]
MNTTFCIEECALEVQREMWDKQFSLWPGEKMQRLDLCDPWLVAAYLGYEVQEGFISGDTRPGYRFGGFVNRDLNLVGISDHQSERAKRFTLAHEVAHLQLDHPGMHHHRELPMQGLETRVPADWKEREANHYAGCLLVPSALLTKAFRSAFNVTSLMLTDEVAWELLGQEYAQLTNSPPHSRALARLIATARRFRGRHFGSLHDLFKVSDMTMAIRLEQTGLVQL